MIFLLHVEWPEIPPYKLLLTYHGWRMFEWHIPSCLEFLAIRRGVELHWEEVTFLLRLQTFKKYFCHVFTFLNVFSLYFNFFLHLWCIHRRAVGEVWRPGADAGAAGGSDLTPTWRRRRQAERQSQRRARRTESVGQLHPLSQGRPTGDYAVHRCGLLLQM